MGHLKQKLVHAAMPHTWFSLMLKHSRKKSPTALHPSRKRKPSQSSKPAATSQKKHSSGSTFTNHKAKDIPFPSTLKKSSLKACREGSPAAKQATDHKQENSQSFDESESRPGPLQSLYRCTMSPNSRRVCAGLDVAADTPTNTHHHLNMAYQYALHGHPCHVNITSRQKNFQLDLEELEMKLNALNPQERWRNTYISPLLSVAVPSPSLVDDAIECCSHADLDSLENSSRRPPSRRMSAVRKLNHHERHERTLYPSSPGNAVCNNEPKNLPVWPYIDFGHDLFADRANGGDSFNPSRKHQLRADDSATGYCKSGSFEAQNRKFMLAGHSRDRDDYGGMKFSSLDTEKASAKKRNPESTSAYNVSVQESQRMISKKNQKMEMRSTQILKNASDDDVRRAVIVDAKSENQKDGSDDSETGNNDHYGQLASQIYREFKLQEKLKLNAMHKKGRHCYPKHKYSGDRNNSLVATPVQDECNDRSLHYFRSTELIRSLSTKSLDSTPSHNTFSSLGTTSTSSQDGINYYESHQNQIPSVSWMPRQGSCIVNDTMQCRSYRSALSPNEGLHTITSDEGQLVHPDQMGFDHESCEATNGCYGSDFIQGNSDVCKMKSSEYYGVLNRHGISCPPINICGTGRNCMHVTRSPDDDENNNADDECRALSATFTGSKALLSSNNHELAEFKNPLVGARVWCCDHAGSPKSGNTSYHKMGRRRRRRRRRESYQEYKRAAGIDDDQTNIRACQCAHHHVLQDGEMSDDEGGRGRHGINAVQGITMCRGCLAGAHEYEITTISTSGYQASGEISDAQNCEDAGTISSYRSPHIALKDEPESIIRPERSSNAPNYIADRNDKEMINGASTGAQAKMQRQLKLSCADDIHLQAEVVWSYNLRQDFKEAMVANVKHLQSINSSADQTEQSCKLAGAGRIRGDGGGGGARGGGGGEVGAGEARLLEMLQFYLALNRPRHHPSIIEAFFEICHNLKQGSSYFD